MIPALDPDSESDFQLFGDSGSRVISSKRGIKTPLSVETLWLWPWIQIWSWIYSLFEIPDPDLVKSGIVTTLIWTV